MRAVKLAAALIAFATLACANTIVFGLAGDPDQNYTFVRTDTPVAGSEYPGMTVTVPAGPYPGWEGQNIPADDNYFVCISFMLTSTFGDSYPGTLIAPSTPAQLEAAYLGAELAYDGDQNASLATKGALSMAIWQITDSTPGDVPRDPSAQPYVSAALAAYQSGALSAADFKNTTIFVPDNPAIQEFMLTDAGAPGFLTLQQEIAAVPEPGTFAVGAALMALGLIRFMAEKSSRFAPVSSFNVSNRIHSLNSGGVVNLVYSACLCPPFDDAGCLARALRRRAGAID